MTDVYLFQTEDGGDIAIKNNDLALTAGLETAVYLSLFGGNEDDDGRPDNPLQWWGNLNEEDPNRRMVSRYQHLLKSLPATTGNLKRLNDAGKADLEWLTELGYTVSIESMIPAVNRVDARIVVNGAEFQFIEEWAIS